MSQGKYIERSLGQPKVVQDTVTRTVPVLQHMTGAIQQHLSQP